MRGPVATHTNTQPVVRPPSHLPAPTWKPPALPPARTSPAPAGSYWQWRKDKPGFAPYKNDILKRYQDAMSSCGIPRTDQRLFVQQVVQENGALDPSLTEGTDLGFSFGIGQWNTSPVRAATHLARYPEQATLEWQISELARSSCEKFALYPGNLRRAIVHHNCPQCAIHNAKPSWCGGVDAWHKKTQTCYFDDEVNGTRTSALIE